MEQTALQVANPPGGGTYQGKNAQGKQTYIDPTGAQYTQNEYDVGKSTYRTDWTMTAPAPAKSNPVNPPAPGNTSNPTAGDIYGGIYAKDPNADAQKAAEDAVTSGYKAGAPNEEDTYTNALNKYQDEIDAINTLYAGKKADVTKQYTQMENQRLGSEGALLANTGMAGSTFGNSKTNELNLANTNELNAANDKVDAEKQAAISSIMTNVRTQASKDYQDKLTAYSQGADKALQYLKDASSRNDTNTTSVAQNAILKGLDLSDPKNYQIVQNIAQTMGVDPSTIIDRYRAAKASYDQAQTKQKADNDKAAADLAKTIAETGSAKATTAKTKAETSKIYSDIGNGGSYQSGGLKIGKSDLSDIQSLLEKGNAQKGLEPKGKDGYANTNTYIKLYDHWVNPPNGQGGLAKDFVSLFPPKTYLNPNDPSLPDQLKEAIKATSINVVIPGVQQ